MSEDRYDFFDDDWLSIKETLYLNSIPGAREAILEGMATPSEELAGKEALEAIFNTETSDD